MVLYSCLSAGGKLINIYQALKQHCSELLHLNIFPSHEIIGFSS